MDLTRKLHIFAFKDGIQEMEGKDFKFLKNKNITFSLLRHYI